MWFLENHENIEANMAVKHSWMEVNLRLLSCFDIDFLMKFVDYQLLQDQLLISSTLTLCSSEC